jgi:hypothetical protein
VATTADGSADAARRLSQYATRLLQGLDSTGDFFRACAGLWSDLAGLTGLDGDRLALFYALEEWESSVGQDRVAANEQVRAIVARAATD